MAERVFAHGAFLALPAGQDTLGTEERLHGFGHLSAVIEPFYRTVRIDLDTGMQGVVSAQLRQSPTIAGGGDVHGDDPVKGLFAFTHSCKAKFNQCYSPWRECLEIFRLARKGHFHLLASAF